MPHFLLISVPDVSYLLNHPIFIYTFWKKASGIVNKNIVARLCDVHTTLNNINIGRFFALCSVHNA